MKLIVNVDNPADKLTEFGAGAKLYWARDNTSATGAFTDATGSVTLDPAVTQYEIYDATGAVGHYYRTRNGKAVIVSGTDADEWAPVFQAGALQAYATLDALREYVAVPDNSRDNLLSDLLVDASGYLDAKCDRDFYRHPAVSGTEVRTFTGNGRGVIPVRAGIISLTGVRMASYTGGTYFSLAATDWVLGPADKPSTAPYTQLLLSDRGTYPYFYSGYATVELTGVFGWPSPPPMIHKATLDIAREWYRQGPGGGGPVGINQFGTPVFGPQIDGLVRNIVAQYGPALVA